jgi:hypothetical protein
MESGGRSWLGWAAVLTGAAVLLLALGDFALVLTNRVARRATDEQAQFIQQTVQLNGIRENLVRQIARAAIETKDQALRDILVSNGFRIQTDPAAAGASPPAAQSSASPPALVPPPSTPPAATPPAAPAEPK